MIYEKRRVRTWQRALRTCIRIRGYFKLTFALQIKPNLLCGEIRRVSATLALFSRTPVGEFLFYFLLPGSKIELREERFARVPISRCQIKLSRARAHAKQNRIVPHTKNYHYALTSSRACTTFYVIYRFVNSQFNLITRLIYADFRDITVSRTL